MTDRFNPESGDLQPLQVGPLAPHLAGFAALIRAQGYCKENGWMKIRLVADLSRWMKARRVAPRQFDEGQAATFLKTRWKRVPHNSGDQATMTLALRHLRET